jgi:hypothetical protein
MRRAFDVISIASTALAAAFVLKPMAAGTAPALAQDFSITNKEERADPSRRDLMRELQAWWDKHAFYSKEAAQADVGGTVKVHLVIHPDGNIFMVRVAESAGSKIVGHDHRPNAATEGDQSNMRIDRPRPGAFCDRLGCNLNCVIRTRPFESVAS